MADLLAHPAATLLHCAKLCQASLGTLLHALFLPLHRVDRRLLLLHGLDGESQGRGCGGVQGVFVCRSVHLSVVTWGGVSQVTIIGYTLGIPDVIMGITFLAAGTSVPDCIASLIVARQGTALFSVISLNCLIGLGHLVIGFLSLGGWSSDCTIFSDTL